MESIPHKLSIIIPALNEEKNLSKTLHMLIESTPMWKDVEYVIIDDGSSDHTYEVAKGFSNQINTLLIRHSKPMGRGYSINEGYKRASGEYLIVFNGKKDTKSSEVKKIFSNFEKADIIISYQANTHERPLIRRVLSRLFTTIINFLFSKRIKYYNGSILLKKEHFNLISPKTSSYAFDCELILQLLNLKLSYIEVPVNDIFEDGRKTRSLNIRNICGVLSTVLRIFWQLRILRSK
ncbi:putative glycosyl transferase [Halobacteriovorax marinus SJ]|uniref:Glycosyl transferase n=1 Tax=Halobacteriovorax marinus (strain ATCC BAA-682 / DSM 15412 / SJ) TaxID=862908 RepID=E1WZU6_HALMS|nr:glycosyltransferase family 2 protein [Halobacteriovorax marinus]CBW27882.1 putative glycosyl transferase [Halobacteriovorax marinus SJ]